MISGDILIFRYHDTKYVYEGSYPTLMNVVATGSGGVNNFGLHSGFGSYPFVQNSVLEGGTHGLRITSDSDKTRVANSKIIGDVDDQAADTIQCLGNFNADLEDVDC